MITSPERYVLDANVFMQAHRQWYRFSFCQGFWNFLISKQQAGLLTSIDRVKNEINPGDALYHWVKNIAPKSMFLSSKSTKVANRYKEVVTWVMLNSKYTPAAKNEFMSEADGWIIAYAWANDMTVVTHEVPSKGTGRVKIPDVCKSLNVPYCTTFKMLDDLKITLKWP